MNRYWSEAEEEEEDDCECCFWPGEEYLCTVCESRGRSLGHCVQINAARSAAERACSAENDGVRADAYRELLTRLLALPLDEVWSFRDEMIALVEEKILPDTRLHQLLEELIQQFQKKCPRLTIPGR